MKIEDPERRSKYAAWLASSQLRTNSLKTSILPAEACRCHNSATTEPIHSKSSSLELSWPVDVATFWSFAHCAHNGISMGIIKAAGILGMPELSNHWLDSLQIKFIGTVLVSKCAKWWSFDHQAHTGMLMGIICEILCVPELSNHWLDSLQIKFIGTVLVSKCAKWWSFDHQAHTGMLMGIICEILCMPELSNHWLDSLHIKFIGIILARRWATVFLTIRPI